MRGFLKSTQGNMTVLFSLMLPVLAGGAALAVDITRMIDERSNLQAVADAAAVAAANELYLANATKQQVISVAETYVRANAADTTGTLQVVADVAYRENVNGKVGDAVEVTASKTIETTFAKFVMTDSLDVKAYSRARVAGGGRICVIGLANDNNATIALDDNAKLSAPTCSVYSNSTQSKGLASINNALLHTEMSCSAGGAEGGPTNYRPAALTDCPQIDDPLASRAPPKVGHLCNHLFKTVILGSHTLSPGVYCGGLKVTGNATVTLKPGVYVIKDGDLTVSKTATLKGENVGFYMMGSNSVFTFSKEATVSLTAPKTGDMAGLLFFQDRRANKNQTFRITSNNARVLLGTIYLPTGVLIVDADMAVADKSAYTAIVAKRLELHSSPNLVLNTDYSLTDVPVPDGVGPVGDGVYLER